MEPTGMGTPQEVLEFWFGKQAQENRRALWFGDGRDVDETIRVRFGETVAAALRGDLDGWTRSARGRLALIVVLDQFTRHVHRGTARAFAGDRAAQRHAMKAIAKGEDRLLGPFERSFLYMPLMHAEDIALQRRGTMAYERLLHDVQPTMQPLVATQRDQALDHAEIVSRFGRFPDRNRLLGRRTTEEEHDFLSRETRTRFEDLHDDVQAR